jgi:hypothetical protein
MQQHNYVQYRDFFLYAVESICLILPFDLIADDDLFHYV